MARCSGPSEKIDVTAEDRAAANLPKEEDVLSFVYPKGERAGQRRMVRVNRLAKDITEGGTVEYKIWTFDYNCEADRCYFWHLCSKVAPASAFRATSEGSTAHLALTSKVPMLGLPAKG